MRWTEAATFPFPRILGNGNAAAYLIGLQSKTAHQITWRP